MTPRERILAAFNHELPDHTPVDGWFHPETVKKLNEYYGTDDFSVVRHDLEVDGWAGCGPTLEFPAYEERAETRSFKGMERRGIWLDERTHADPYGVVHRIGDSGWYEEWVTGPLVDASGEDLTAIDVLEFPGVESIAQNDETARRVAEYKAKGLFVRAGISNPYKTAWLLRGMDNVLMDYLINRPFLEKLYDRIYALYTEMMVRAVKAGVDMVSVTGDVAMQDRIIMGPESWREVDKPRLAKFIADCRAVNPDVFMFIHSDGNMMDLMDDLVEIGFNVINPIQPECMDPVEVKKRWGDRITIHGGISLQHALPNGTVDEVREEVNDLIRHCGYNGGLVMFPSNVIQPGTPPENIVACFHAARDYDLRG